MAARHHGSITLTLVTGPANSAKAGEVLGAYAARAPRGALLVVPTAADARHYERELAAGGAVLGSVLTADGLLETIAARAGYAGGRLSALQRDRVIAGVVAELGFDALGRSARAPGFVAAAGELIAELQRALVTPQRFTAALRAWAAQDVRRAPFSRDVGRVYSAYAQALERLGVDDRERFGWRALDALRAAPDRWGRDAVFLYGFDDLTALERDAVETLARIPGVGVTVSLTYESGRAALVARAGSVQELAPLADETVALPASDTYYAPGSRAVLHRLERSLFELETPEVTDSDGADPTGVVTLLEAGGERAEAELVAAEVLALLRDGTDAAEVCVVYRSTAGAAEVIGAVFDAYGIPLAAPRATPLGHTALGRALLGAARCALLGDAATPADLLDYLRAPGLLRSPDVADELEATVRRDGLTTAAQARAALEALGFELGELRSIAAAGAGPEGDPGPELCRLAGRLLAAPHRAAAAPLRGSERLDAHAAAALERAVAQLSALRDADRRLGRIDAEEYLQLLAGLPVAAGTDRGGGVLLADPTEIRARRFAAVFVCGLQEGEFPAGAAGEAFLSDERRRSLAAASGLALPGREDALDGERYLFYATVSRATERVYLSWRSSDEEGNLALASPFVADVVELLGPQLHAHRRTRLLADVTWPVGSAPTPRERERAVAAAGAPLTGEAPEPDRALGAEALSRMRHTHVVSAGALERYADCPMRWLIESELAPDRLAPTAEPLARGSLIHAVLERLLSELDGPITAGNLADAERLLARLIAELARDARDALGTGQPAAVRAGALRAIEADLRRYLRHEAATGAGWRPLGLELRFGFEEADESGRAGGDAADVAPPGLPALVLGEGADAVRVRGVIDRLDGDGAGHVAVRDYKSGAASADWPVARWTLDNRLQVALYMLVARDLMGADPVAGVYQPLRGEDLRARGVHVGGSELGSGAHPRDVRSGEEVDEALADAAQRAIELAARLRSGELTPCPQTCSRDGCAYPAICRSN